MPIKTNITNNPALSQAGNAKVHFRVLDSWRGVAALLVAIFHLNVFSAIYSLDFIRNAYLFVDFFFVLSGFVITHSYGARVTTLKDLGSFALRRLGRLWPLHATVLLALIIVESARAASAARGTSFYNPPFTGTTSLHSVLTHIGFAQSFGIEGQLTWNPPSWSISAEFWTYLVFGGVLLIATTWLRRIRFATEFLVTALLIGSAAILILFARQGIDATYDLGFVRCVYGFLLGHLTYRLWRATSHIRFDTKLLEVGSLILVSGFVSCAGHTAISFCAPLVFAAVVFVFAFEAGPVSSVMLNKGNAWLGQISYSIYMWQAFIIFNFVDRPVSMLEKATGQAFTTTEGVDPALGGEAVKLIVFGGHVVPIVVTLLFVGLVVAVGSASYYLVEKPGQDWFARATTWLLNRAAQVRRRSLRPNLASALFHLLDGKTVTSARAIDASRTKAFRPSVRNSAGYLPAPMSGDRRRTGAGAAAKTSYHHDTTGAGALGRAQLR
jgi:peptidoglycan/LPS O-acetylase OafA/YrhL